jgi:hypothetical protein
MGVRFIRLIIQSNSYLFACYLKCPRANYKVNKSERKQQTNTKQQKDNFNIWVYNNNSNSNNNNNNKYFMALK